MSRLFLLVLTLTITFSCLSALEDTFNSKELISSKGEKIYVNTLNWGVTDNHQISAISASKDKVKERSDTLETVRGLEPFLYSFKNDTLSFYFDDIVRYRRKDDFKTIYINYISLAKEDYQKIQTKAYKNQEGYHSVPIREYTNYPADMPKPPKERQ